MRNRLLTLILILLSVSLIFIYIAIALEKDSDLDGIPDDQDTYKYDYDNDGMPDIWERKHGLRYDGKDEREDPDNDGLTNVEEYKKGTDPLVSEKTNERVAPTQLFSIIEITLARVLIWTGVIFLIAIIVFFILYRAHIFRIFRFMHHVSTKHFEKEEIQRTTGQMQRQQSPRQYAMPQRYYPRYQFRQQEQFREEIKPLQRPAPVKRTIQQEVPSPKEEVVEERPKLTSEERKKKVDDIFLRLSNKVDETKESKALDEERLRKLAEI